MYDIIVIFSFYSLQNKTNFKYVILKILNIFVLHFVAFSNKIAQKYSFRSIEYSIYFIPPHNGIVL